MSAKKSTIALAVALVAATPLVAQAGYTGPGAQPPAKMSAQEAIKAADDTAVVLEGHIVRHLGKDRYLFRDASGEITVEIDHKHMPKASFDAKQRVRLTGEVDRELVGQDEVDVKQVELLK